jgi:hypothetical protein
MRPEVIIDASQLSDLAGFAKHFSEVALGGQHRWNGNLDVFNDIRQIDCAKCRTPIKPARSIGKSNS